MAPAHVRVLIVDDSPTVRAVLARKLDASPQIDVIGRAADGLEALDFAQRLQPDVITLDVEMPNLDGLQTLERLMRERPTPVIMVSSLTGEGTDATIRALQLGAVDFIEKPVYGHVAAPHKIADDLIDKVLAASRARLHPRRPSMPPRSTSRSGIAWADRLVVIGSSTGGPPALQTVLGGLPGDFGAPIVVVQHMPAYFTRSLAERLDGQCAITVEQAHPGSRLEAGVALIAPGGFHLRLLEDRTCSLTEEPLEHGVRPAVNITLESAAATVGKRTVAAVLTGMGVDGTRGAQLVRAAGGTVFAEAEETCTIYGMPRSIVEHGLANRVVPLHQMADTIIDACRRTPLRKAG